MTCQEVMTKLESMGNEKMRAVNMNHGAGENHFGVNLSHLRDLAKEIKKDHELALELWETGNIDAQLLATQIMKPSQLTPEEVTKMMEPISYFKVADWVVVNLVKPTKKLKEPLREPWMDSDHEMIGRAGWSLHHERVTKGPLEGIDLSGTLDRIEKEMKDAPMRKQETMNYCLGEIGIRYPEYRARCIDIGERLGVFKDYPTPKGCITPYAPEWIAAIVARQEG